MTVAAKFLGEKSPTKNQNQNKIRRRILPPFYPHPAKAENNTQYQKWKKNPPLFYSQVFHSQLIFIIMAIEAIKQIKQN